MDQPVPRHSGQRIPARTKQALIARFAQVGSIIQVATEFGVHRHTVRRILLSVRNDSRSGLDDSWKKSTKKLAISAVDAGLVHDADPYKRGELGNKVLVGLGEFKAETQVQLGFQVNVAPPELLAQLVGPDDDNPKM